MQSGKKLGQNSSRNQFSDAPQLGCVFQDMTPPKSILRKSTDMPKPIQRVKSQRLLRVTLKFETKIPRSVTFVQVNFMSVAPMLRNLRIVHKKREWHEAAWKLAKSLVKIKGAPKSNILLTFVK